MAAWLPKLSATAIEQGRNFPSYRNSAYSALACFRMGMSGSAPSIRVSGKMSRASLLEPVGG